MTGYVTDGSTSAVDPTRRLFVDNMTAADVPAKTGHWCYSGQTLALEPPSCLFGIFTHLKLCLADAIHNFK